MTGVLIRRGIQCEDRHGESTIGRHRDTQKQKEDGHVEMEAETTVKPEAKVCLGLSGSGRSKEGSASRDFGENMSLMTP